MVNICIASDFFFPRNGGVETHVFSLSQALIARGHKIVVLTVTAGNRQGVRYMTNGLKVYYTPQQGIFGGAAAPGFGFGFPLIRQILIREQIEVVHSHQSTGFMGHRTCFQAKTMGLPTVFTDHSLFGFGDIPGIHLNRFVQFAVAEANQCIAVSHTCKENLALRTEIDPDRISVIPNAVDPSKFVPDPSKAPSISDQINIIIVSRLEYRKGISLAVDVIPKICKRFPKVHFYIGGDGSKRIDLVEMREYHEIEDRIHLLGNIPHAEVRDLLVRGHIFLNCSLTESFCIAILEAACCGLYVVASRVGGVPEVLPPHMVSLAHPRADDMIDALSKAIENACTHDPWKFHEQIKSIYQWSKVAEKTEKVYLKVLKDSPLPISRRLQVYYNISNWFGKVFCIFTLYVYALFCVLEYFWPRGKISIAKDFRRATSKFAKQ